MTDARFPNSFYHTTNTAGTAFPTGTYDVVVYGGTIAGINAAYAAGLNGAKVALLEPTGQLGGMTGPGGLTVIDMFATEGANIGGTFWQEYQEFAVRSGVSPNPGWPTITAPTAAGTGQPSQITGNSLRPSPQATMRTLKRWAYLSPNVSVFLNAAISTTGGTVDRAAVMAGPKITALNTSLGKVLGTVFIDASYEGDLLRSVASQGYANYTVGRESSAKYSESLAGRSLGSPTSYSGVSFATGGVPVSPFILDPGGSAGGGDAHVQPMSFRVPLLQSTSAVAFTQPAGYDARNYMWIGGIAAAGSYTTLSQISALTTFFVAGVATSVAANDGGNVFCMANNGDAYPDATPTQRATIFNNVKTWWQGFFYYLSHDATVPSAVRTNTLAYGYDPVQFATNNFWPYQMYIREGRRMIGSYVMTEADIVNSTTAGDSKSIGKGSYALDIHPCAIYASSNGSTVTLDGVQADNNVTYGNFQFPLGSIIPATGQCSNLIVPVCMSCSHIAWGAIRLEPSFAILGDAAGLMAYRVAKGGDASVQSIDYSALSTLLTALRANF